MYADVAELDTGTGIMRLEPDVAAVGPATIRYEAAHRHAVERHREMSALRCDDECIPLAGRP
jgi:hypothetical protein